jgi:hypothetical protein
LEHGLSEPLGEMLATMVAGFTTRSLTPMVTKWGDQFIASTDYAYEHEACRCCRVFTTAECPIFLRKFSTVQGRTASLQRDLTLARSTLPTQMIAQMTSRATIQLTNRPIQTLMKAAQACQSFCSALLPLVALRSKLA